MTITPEQFQAMQQRLAPKTRLPAALEDAVDDEIPLHSEIIKWFKSQFPRVPYVHSRTDKKSRVTKGAVDFVFGYKGRTFWIEVKTRDGKRTTEQLAFALLLEMQGLKDNYAVIRSMTEFYQFISSRVGLSAETV